MPIAAAVALLISTSLAQATAELPPPPPPPDEVPAAAPGLPRFGLAVDAGAPEGVVASALYRPFPALRIFAGPSWNYSALGFHAGATVVPWRFALTPTLSVEGGRYFSSDLSWLARDSRGVPAALEPLLRDVSYAYGSLHAGLEVGSPSGLALSVSAGLSYLSVRSRGTATTTAGGARVELSDPRIRAVLPSVKLGLQYWF